MIRKTLHCRENKDNHDYKSPNIPIPLCPYYFASPAKIRAKQNLQFTHTHFANGHVAENLSISWTQSTELGRLFLCCSSTSPAVTTAGRHLIVYVPLLLRCCPEQENRICRSPPSHPEYITDRAHSPLLLPLLCSVSQFSCQQRRRRFCLRRYGPVCVLRRTASLERTNERMAASTAELPPHHSLTEAPQPPRILILRHHFCCHSSRHPWLGEFARNGGTRTMAQLNRPTTLHPTPPRLLAKENRRCDARQGKQDLCVVQSTTTHPYPHPQSRRE